MHHIRLDAFEGPMDLLLHLIEKNRIDIADIPIAELTDQYLAFIETAPREMDDISEFLVMAATLLEIKSKTLLPPEPPSGAEPEDPREALARKLMEYKQFKAASDALREIGQAHPGYATRPPDAGLIALAKARGPTDIAEFMPGMTAEKLFRIYGETLRRRERRTDTIRSGFRSIPRDLYTVEAGMAFILSMIERHGRVGFAALAKNAGRAKIVATFLALLELIKQERVVAHQTDWRADIVIFRFGEG